MTEWQKKKKKNNMKKEGKIWGENILIFINDTIQINQIYIKAGGQCSKHKHNNKNNIFYVQKGLMKIEIWQQGGLIDETILSDGQQTIIDCGKYHRFTALSETMALEIYTIKNIEENDIDRETIGSIIKL